MSPLNLFVSFRFTGAIFLEKTSDEKLKTFVMYFFGKNLNKTFELYRTFEFWSKSYNESSREREEIVQVSNNFVRPTEIFEISRVFWPKKVCNVQGTEEFVPAIKKFEKLSIRVFESQLYLKLESINLERLR